MKDLLPGRRHRGPVAGALHDHRRSQDHGHGHDKHGDDDRDEHDHGHGRGHDHDKGRGHDHDRYDDHDRDAARDWYRAHHSHLPPGLEEQLVVRGTLPPGLGRQMQPCPHELEAMFPPSPPNYAHVVIGGNLVPVNRLNFQIAAVMHLEVNF